VEVQKRLKQVWSGHSKHLRKERSKCYCRRRLCPHSGAITRRKWDGKGNRKKEIILGMERRIRKGRVNANAL